MRWSQLEAALEVYGALLRQWSLVIHKDPSFRRARRLRSRGQKALLHPEALMLHPRPP